MNPDWILALPHDQHTEHHRPDHQPVRRRHRPGRPGRSPPPVGPHPLRRPAGRRRLGAGHPGRTPPGYRRSLARLRLARGRGAAERVPPVPHPDRRTDHPLPAHPLRARGRGPAAAHPHLPGVGARLPRPDRSAHRSRGPRRHGSRRVPSGDPEPARNGFQHPARRRRVDHGADRPCLRHPDAGARLPNGAHGSDGGAMVSRELAMAGVPGFLGAHVLQLFSFPSGTRRSSRR